MTNWPSYSKDEIDAVASILSSGKVNYWTGNECKEFELEFARFVNTKYAISLSNGTVALELALKSLNLSHGDEVIVTPRSFIASVSSVVNIGAKPVFADVDLNSQNITASSIEKKITPRTRAILCVHLAGWPCEMDSITKLAKSKNLYVIEDCAQAHGAMYKGASVGSFGDIGCWSFCQDKIISTAGEGGMITTNNNQLWEKIWSLKDHGKNYQKIQSASAKNLFNWVHDSFGSNYRMTEIQAAIGRIQLGKLYEWNRKRNENSSMIWKTAKKFKALRVPEIPSYINHAGYRCYIFVKQNMLKEGFTRDKIIQEIYKHGIKCFVGSCPEIYMEKAFKDHDSLPKKRLANAKELGDSSLAFLVHQDLEFDYISLTCRVLEKVMFEASK